MMAGLILGNVLIGSISFGRCIERRYREPPAKTISLFMGFPFSIPALLCVIYTCNGVVTSLSEAFSTT
jgi:hypothetical protein